SFIKKSVFPFLSSLPPHIPPGTVADVETETTLVPLISIRPHKLVDIPIPNPLPYPYSVPLAVGFPFPGSHPFPDSIIPIFDAKKIEPFKKHEKEEDKDKEKKD